MNPERPNLKLYTPPDPKEDTHADPLAHATGALPNRASLTELRPVGVHLRIYNPDMNGEFGEQTAKFKASLTYVQIQQRMMVSENELAAGPSVLCKLPASGSSPSKSFIITRESDGGFSITIPPEKSSTGVSRFLRRGSEEVQAIFDKEGEVIAAYSGKKLASDPQSILAQIDDVIARRLVQYTDEALFGDSVGRCRLK